MFAGVYGWSNSSIEKPFQKVCRGKQRFSRLVEEYGSVAQQEALLQELWDLMGDETRSVVIVSRRSLSTAEQPSLRPCSHRARCSAAQREKWENSPLFAQCCTVCEHPN